MSRKSVVDMTIAVDWDVKPQNKKKNNNISAAVSKLISTDGIFCLLRIKCPVNCLNCSWYNCINYNIDNGKLKK